MKDVLIVDDEVSVGEALGDLLKRANHSSGAAANRMEARRAVESGDYRTVLMDLRMPDVKGLDLLDEIRSVSPRLPVIMMTAYSSVRTAVEAIQRGACDFITKPIDREELLGALRRALRQSDAETATSDLFFALPQDAHAVFRDPRSLSLVEQIRGTASTLLPVLITGESGVGKEVFARLIHELSLRKTGPFVKVNCAAVPEALFESELFGYEKGAFSGAAVSKPGRVEIAENGTLFLDEIGELTKAAQAKLLQFLQDRSFERVGGLKTRKVNVRIVAATNRDLKEALRDDLFYRLSGISIHVPPLRERPGDIEPLARRILDRHPNKLEVAGDVWPALRSYRWPGNVRELEQRLERALALCKNSTLGIEDILPKDTPAPAPPAGLKAERAAFERSAVEKALQETGGNRTEAARKLGISRRMLQKKLRNLDIKD